MIAKKVYGDEYCADILMQANPEQVGTFRFDSGVVLKTPALTEEQSGSLPPWKVS
uniref:phage tail protein n=1 Tax=Faecalibacterium prausnitzii TaxID=853 RepID=UPI0040389488